MTKVNLFLLLLIATPPAAFAFLSMDAVDEENRYMVKFKEGRRRRLQGSPATVVDDPNPGNDGVFSLASTNDPSIMSLPEDDVEVMILPTEEDVRAMEEHEDVEYVEKDEKVFLNAEQTPYGITMTKALSVSDSKVSNRKVCIVDSGYDWGHPDLSSSTSVVSGVSNPDDSWWTDENSHGTWHDRNSWLL